MAAIYPLLGFAGWTLILVLIVFVYRGIRLLGGTPITSWPRGGAKPANEAGLAIRAGDAHANAVENLVVFAAIVLGAFALGRADRIAMAAHYVLFARIGQSVVHLIGVNTPLVLLRATFWSIQLLLMFWMLWQVFA